MVNVAVLRVLLALVLAGAGALLGAAVHWWVVQPSDAELVATARTVGLPGFAGQDQPQVTGAWAPSSARGVVHWDTTSPTPLSPAGTAVVAALEEQGWTVTESGRTWDVVATRPGRVLTVHLRTAPDGGTHASVSLERGPTTASLRALVVGGAATGGVVAAALAAAHARRRHLPGPPGRSGTITGWT
ncbi:hypothetical protein [Actinotalea ferrariae]|uniref:hypothetical protein n=1 Tax=Actinotalea ferrariae TaxID=1386098 RepID=UPI0012DE2587|nr:hypothetical protein [Actinotalea ferrariae]